MSTTLRISVATQNTMFLLAMLTCALSQSSAVSARDADGDEAALASASVADAARSCTFVALDGNVRVRNSSEFPSKYLSEVCLNRALPVNDERVACQVRVDFSTEELTQRYCREQFRGTIERDGAGELRCSLFQLLSDAPLAAKLPGFFYDDSSPGISETCPSEQRIDFVPDNLLYTLDEFTLKVHCELSSEAEGAVDCHPPVQMADAARNLGRACEPTPVDPTGFDIAEVSLSGSKACGSGLCMAYHLEGSIDPGCDPAQEICVDEKAMRERVQCSCRCSADEPGDAQLCACPDSFVCEQVLDRGAAEGGYCVPASLTTPQAVSKMSAL